MNTKQANKKRSTNKTASKNNINVNRAFFVKIYETAFKMKYA